MATKRYYLRTVGFVIRSLLVVIGNLVATWSWAGQSVERSSFEFGDACSTEFQVTKNWRGRTPPIGVSALLTTRAEASRYLQNSTGIVQLADRIKAIDFSRTALLVHFFEHRGSGMNRLAHRARFKDGVLSVEIYDAAGDGPRSADLRTQHCRVVVTCDKAQVNRIDVKHFGGRSYDLKAARQQGLEKAATLVRSFPAYADLSRQDAEQITQLDFRHHRLSAEEAGILAELPNLETLYLGRNGAASDVLEKVAECNQLRRLVIHRPLGQYPIGRNDVTSLKGLPEGLISLDLSGNKIASGQLAELAKMPKLETLVLRRASLTRHDLEAIATLTQLKHLDLRDNILTKSLFEKLANSTLQTLKVSDLCGMRDLSALQEIDTLRHLVVNVSTLNDDHLLQISQMSGLTHLDVSGHSQVTDKGIGYLATLTALESLSLGYAKVSDKGIQQLASLSLKRLDLRSTRLSTDGFQWVAAECPELEELNLRATKATVKDCLTLVGSLTNLQRLGVPFRLASQSPVDQHALSHLQVFTDDISFADGH